MQSLVVVSIFDSAAQLFQKPIFAPSAQQVVRQFGDLCNDKETEYGKHPDDYEVYRIAGWQDDTAKFTVLDKPELIVRGKDLVRG